ncbi:MAG TPA: CocE/NonD family hydrolase [Mycobacteriales bacterium]|nr:CocE/NonD family hydrolase [Mycobacteriales bacterium]
MRRTVVTVLAPLLLVAGLALPSRAASSPYAGFVAEHSYVATPFGDLYVEYHRPAHGRMPVLLQMSPYRYVYGRVRAQGVATDFYSARYAPKGYAIAYADVLGTGESSGCWDYGGPAEAAAGAAVVEWLGTRSWSNGRVGMIGTSYDGATQAEIATLAPPHLAAIVPQEPVTSWYGYNYDHAVTHNSTDDDPSPTDTGYPVGTPDVFDLALSRTPNTDPDRDPGQHLSNGADKASECEAIEHNLRGHLADPSYGGFWRDRDWALRAGKVKAAVLMQQGWRDFNTKPDQFTRYWLSLRGAADRRAVVGQWDHTDVFADDLRGSPAGSLRDYLDAFFARHLKGAPASVLKPYPPVMSQGYDGRWRTSLPLATRHTRFTGTMDVPFVNSGTETSKAWKHLPLGTDPNAATLVSAPLRVPLRLVGAGQVQVDVSVQSVRGQLDATLLDVAPDDSVRVITLGLLDLRYAGSPAAPRALVPGQVNRVTVVLRPQDAVVAAGHRIAVVLTGSEAVWGVPDPVAGQLYEVRRVRMELPLVKP